MEEAILDEEVLELDEVLDEDEDEDEVLEEVIFVGLEACV